MKWEIDTICYLTSGYLPKIKKGWEPFAVTRTGNGSYLIWLRKQVKVKKKS